MWFSGHNCCVSFSTSSSFTTPSFKRGSFYYFSAVEEIANVNIPVPNGVLSIRPTEMSSVDASIINKFDDVTIEQLKRLQQNLNMIMDAAERTHFKMNK